MRKIFSLLIVILGLFFLISCDYGIQEIFYRENDVEKRAKSLTLIDNSENIANNTYSVLLITDTHFGRNKERKCDNLLFKWLDSLETDKRPFFCICLGDVAESGKPEQIDEFVSFTSKLKEDYGMTTYTVIGNHDLYNSGWNYWKEKVFPNTSFYKFSTNVFSWYFLDSASGSIGYHQYEELSKDMEKDDKIKLVFTHYPFYANGEFYFCLQDTVERNKLLTLFETNGVINIYVGHTHDRNTSYLSSIVEENIPGFLDRNKWGLLKIDEKLKTSKLEIYGK